MKKNKGITLIALVITIIVMLILVAVTIRVATEGNLFRYAGNSVKTTKNAVLQENYVGEGKIQIGGDTYDSITDYIEEQTAPFKRYILGEEVEIEDEPFIVLENSNGNEEKIKLISKYSLNATENKQCTDNSITNFDYTVKYSESSTAYEGSYAELLVNAYVSGPDSKLKLTLEQGEEARLLTYNELKTLTGLETLNEGTQLPETPSWLVEGRYWIITGVSYNAGGVQLGKYRCGAIRNDGYINQGSFGVRPVLIISKSKLD